MKAQDARFLIDAIGGKKCSAWDLNFIKSISAQILRGKDLTSKQAAALQALYSKSQGGGVYQERQFIR